MLIKNRECRIFFAIIILAIFLRFYNLSSIPPSPSLDEVSIGYNGYSILKTGADEYGTKFPILLRAYDDFRPALYVYLVIPFVKIFGLSAFSVRLPSVILSILIIFSTYFLVKELFKRWEIAVLTSFLLTISPWHIYVSRLGHEVNAGLSFFIFGLTFFIRRQLFFGILFFALSLISYQSEKIFLPVFLIGLCILFRKEIFLQKKQLLLGCFISCIILFPFVKVSLQPNALIRFNATNIFNANSQRYIQESLFLADAVKNNNFPKQLFHNRRVVSLKIFSEGYIAHFNPQWLFFNASEDRHKVPNLGLFYIWESPFLVLGIIFFIVQKFSKKVKILIFLWILIAPLPAAITTDAPHALRIYQMLPIPQVLTALGLFQTFLFFKKYYISKIALFFVFEILAVGSLMYFYNEYFVVFPKTQSASFQYPLSKTIPFVLEREGAYNKIIFSNKDNLYQSYMFFLFYSKYDPVLYQKQGGTKSGGFAESHSFGKYEFRPIDWQREKKTEDTFYIGNMSDFPSSISAVKTFSLLDGKEVIKIALRK